MMRAVRVVLVAALVWWAAAATPAESPEELLERAVYADEMVGDLEAAMGLYRRIVEDAEASRPHVAEAHYRLGMALLKAGRIGEGCDALEGMVQRFPEQAELVRRARIALLARSNDSEPRNPPKAWFYIDSKEVPGGDPAELAWTVVDQPAAAHLPAPEDVRTTEPDQDAVVISYLAEGSFGSHPQLSVAMNDANRILLQFPLPEKRKWLLGARLRLDIHLPPSSEIRDPIEVAVHAIEAPWREETVTWLNQPSFSLEPVATAAVPVEGGMAHVDITPLAREWIEETRPNHGLLVKVAAPYFGPPPLDTDVPGKYTAEEAAAMDLDTLWRRMVHPETGRAQFAGLWALIAKAQTLDTGLSPVIGSRAIECLNDRTRWSYERWLCAYLLAGIRNEMTVPMLAAFLVQDPDVAVREGAAGALGAYAAPEAHAALEGAVAAGLPGRVRVVVNRALRGELAPVEIPVYLADIPRAAPSVPDVVETGDPKRDAETLQTRGWAAWQQGQMERAEACFARAAALDPGLPNVWNGLGWALLNQNRPQAAKEAFEKAVDLDPKHPAALNGLGWIARREDRTDEAVGYWKRAVDAEPKASAAWSGLATVYMETEQYAKAVEAYGKILEAEPGNAEVKAALEKAQAAANARE